LLDCVYVFYLNPIV